jgi:outer membrane protein OmpA-like peptidoglycan-associated protein
MVLGLALLAAARLVRADHDPFLRSFDAVPIKPTPTASSGLVLDGVTPAAPNSLHAALVLDINAGILSLRYGNQKLGDLIPLRADARLMVAYQLTPRLELAGDLPVTLFQWDNMQLLRDRGFPQPGVSAVALGDLRALARYVVLDGQGGPVALAAIGEVRANTGDGYSFTGDRSMVFAPRVAVEKSFGGLRLLGNAGAQLRFHGQFLNLYVGHQITLGLGGIYRLPDRWMFRQPDVRVEVNLFTPLEAPFTFRDADSLRTPWELLVGAQAKVLGPFRVGVALGRGVGQETGYGREALRVMAILRFDHESADTDEDGVPDGADGCPGAPEDKDGWQDGDGCPDPDNDEDGVADPDDLCPGEAGPRALDGCPDRDEDEIPDIADKCPDEPGPPEREGCPYEEPAVVLETDRIRITNNIFFETGEARLQEKSFPLLDEVYKVLKENPDVGPVRVDGHTDNRGSRAYNLDLSNRRARAVMEYLIKKGIDPKRLSHKGFGFDKPVDTNDTPIGRAKNRRVEFNLIGGQDEEAAQELEDTGAKVAPPPDAEE